MPDNPTLPSWWGPVANEFNSQNLPAQVPPNIWLPILYAESQGRPNIQNTAGEPSYGLFQLYTEGPAGRGQGYGASPSQLYDPAFNAYRAAPAIARAYSQFGNNIAEVARNSGHPGYVPISDERIRTIQNYQQQLNNPATPIGAIYQASRMTSGTNSNSNSGSIHALNGWDLSLLLPQGGIYGDQKWMPGNAIDVFTQRGFQIRAPANGTVQQGPGGFIFSDATGQSARLIHVQAQAQGQVQRGQVIGVVNDPTLDTLGSYPGMPDGFQHIDLAFANSPTGFSLASPGAGGDIPASALLQSVGYGRHVPGSTSGPGTPGSANVLGLGNIGGVGQAIGSGIQQGAQNAIGSITSGIGDAVRNGITGAIGDIFTSLGNLSKPAMANLIFLGIGIGAMAIAGIGLAMQGAQSPQGQQVIKMVKPIP